MRDFRSRAVAIWTATILTLAMTPVVARAQASCAALPAPTGAIVNVTPAQVGSLQSILDAARAGDTVQLADGTYSLPTTLVFRNDGVTLRSKSGNRAAVVIDGAYAVGDVLLVQRSNITIADLTLMRSYWHLVHVAADGGSLSGTTLHNLRGIDGGQQFIKVNGVGPQYADSGVIRCSSLELTDVGRTFIRDNCYTGGIDIHQARGWQIYANTFSGFWCSSGLSEHAIHAWKGSRDTVIDRNIVINSARGIGLGLGTLIADNRTYDDAPCGSASDVGQYGGAITNNFVVANDPRLFSSNAGFDTGIGLEQSCATNVLHNSVASTTPPRSSSIEWRFGNTSASIANNLVTHTLLPRDGATATLAGNVVNAPLSVFTDVASANLHLLPTATIAIDKAAVLASPVVFDIDSERRPVAADVGADEYMPATATYSLTASATAIAGSAISVSWTTNGASASDWVGLYAAGAADTSAIDKKATSGQASGSVSFTAPPTAGSYEARYFSGTGSTRIAVSNPINVTAPPSTGDSTPPSVRISSPVDGQRVSKPLSITVVAADNVAVTKVELYVDGALKASSSTAPFTMSWNPKSAKSGSHLLQAKAYDAAGNTAMSPTVTVIR